MDDFIYRSATDLAALIRGGQATSQEIVKAHLEHIKKHNPALNAVVILLEEEALETARACDEEARRGQFRGPLHGVPITVKEQFWLKGTKSTLNVKMFRDWLAPEDAVVADRLKKAGAVILGKPNVPRNLLDFQVWGDIYPEGKNPYNPEHTPGGSSGGAAAYKRCKMGSPIAHDAKTVRYGDYCCPYVGCFNATGHPAMNIPLGLGSEGLPVGVQIVGPYWSEPELIRFAKLASAWAGGFVRPAGY